MTVGEVELMLVYLYRSKRILLDPRISVEAISLRPFFILGEVEKRGSYPYMPGLTVAQAVAIAGDYTYRASRSRVTVQRQGASEERASQDTLLHPRGRDSRTRALFLGRLFH
jgi:polysaccharide export outer membrane protein